MRAVRVVDCVLLDIELRSQPEHLDIVLNGLLDGLLDADLELPRAGDTDRPGLVGRQQPGHAEHHQLSKGMRFGAAPAAAR